MDEDLKEKLRRKLESGEITQDIFDEMVTRWSQVFGVERNGEKEKDNAQEDAKETEKPKNGNSRKQLISVWGSGNFSNVDAEEFRVSGGCKVSGNVLVDKMSVTGSAHVSREIVVKDKLSVSGALKSDSYINANAVDASGSVSAEKLQATDVNCSGAIRIKGDVDSTSINVSGLVKMQNLKCSVMKCSGALIAENVDGSNITVNGKIEAEVVKSVDFELTVGVGGGSIGTLDAERVKVRRRRMFFRTPMAQIKEVKCKTADLEAVSAKSVIGDDIVIGDFCEIDYVEANTLRVSEGATVKERKIR